MRTHYFLLLTMIVTSFTWMAAPLHPVLAQNDRSFRDGFEAVDGERKSQGISNFGGSFTVLILGVLRVITFIVGALALGALVYGAIMYIVSFGNDQRAETAKKIILYAIVGLLVLGVSGVVVNVLINLIRA